MKRILYALCATTILVGCGTVSTDEVYGMYVAEYPFGTEILVLNPDSTYTQIVHISDPPDTVIHTGNWKFDSTLQNISLYNGLSVITAFGELRANYKTPVDGIIGRRCRKLTPWSSLSLLGGCEGYLFIKKRGMKSK